MISAMQINCRPPNNLPPVLPPQVAPQVAHGAHPPVVNVANRIEVAPPFLIQHASILEKVVLGALVVGQGVFALFDPLSLTDQCIVGGFIIYSAFKKASAKFNAVIIEPRQNIETRISQLSLVAALTGIAVGMLLDLSFQKAVPGIKGAVLGFLFGMMALKKGSSLELVRGNNLPSRGRALSKQIFESLLKPLCTYSHKEAVVKILFLSYFTFEIGQIWKQKQGSTLSNPLADVVRLHISHSLKATFLAPLSIEICKRTKQFLAWL